MAFFVFRSSFPEATTKMKKMLSTAALVLATVVSALGQGTIDVEFTNATGELFGTSSQLQFTNGILVSVGQDGQAPFLAGFVGTVTFTTPIFTSGSVQNGGAFGVGGSFYIASPYNVDINATFVRGSWKFSRLPNGTFDYALVGQIQGTLFLNGTTYNMQGVSVQLSVNTGRSHFLGLYRTSGGNTDVVTVP
jgi:hypothetical protein